MYLIGSIRSVRETLLFKALVQVVQSIRKSHLKFRFKMSKAFGKVVRFLHSRMFNEFSEALESSFYCSVL